eukprot:CAMPEP_0118978306 /NCGR_PEP_ID=MMETSP1173-20130426/23347_1 /TAXON_ID=1034831 /ORGANISM="Rhizochromulina marina cf, Strain CCMP1243" /LENGTH=103 /DNA_ID=CAMNT_0006928489 /DNA_START=109 /DNA_END=420 /DNA_ORIENTATION=+
MPWMWKHRPQAGPSEWERLSRYKCCQDVGAPRQNQTSTRQARVRSDGRRIRVACCAPSQKSQRLQTWPLNRSSTPGATLQLGGLVPQPVPEARHPVSSSGPVS